MNEREKPIIDYRSATMPPRKRALGPWTILAAIAAVSVVAGFLSRFLWARPNPPQNTVEYAMHIAVPAFSILTGYLGAREASRRGQPVGQTISLCALVVGTLASFLTILDKFQFGPSN